MNAQYERRDQGLEQQYPSSQYTEAQLDRVCT